MIDHSKEKKVRVLYEISGITDQLLNLNQTFGTILDILSSHLSMEQATITLHQPDGEGPAIRVVQQIPGQAQVAVDKISSSSDANKSSLEIMEKETVIESLERNNWIQNRAARDLGITIRQMGYRVKKYNLSRLIREGKKRR